MRRALCLGGAALLLGACTDPPVKERVATRDRCAEVVAPAHSDRAHEHAGHDPLERRHALAVLRLARLDEAERSPCLRRLVLAPEPETRELAILLLGGELRRGTIDPAPWATDEEPAFRSGVVLAIGTDARTAHAVRAVDALGDPAPVVRVAGARTLRALAVRTAAALDALASRLDDPFAEVRAEAVSSLGVLAPPADRAALVPRVTSLLEDPDTEVRRRAEHALRAWGATAIAEVPR